MLRIFLFLIFGLLPLSAQTSMDQSATVNPVTPPATTTFVTNATSPEAPSSISTNFQLPEPPPILTKLVRFTVSPGTIREGLTDGKAVKTTITLSAPATKVIICHVISSNLKEMVCSDITFLKGEQQKDGAIQIKWKNVVHDCQLGIKTFDADNPETLLQTRIYLRKQIK